MVVGEDELQGPLPAVGELLGITDENMSSFYSQYYEKRFCRCPADGYNYIEKMMESVDAARGFLRWHEPFEAAGSMVPYFAGECNCKMNIGGLIAGKMRRKCGENARPSP